MELGSWVVGGFGELGSWGVWEVGELASWGVGELGGWGAGAQIEVRGYSVEPKTVEKSCADREVWTACVNPHTSKTQLSAQSSENR